jgi:hypothetical protein
MPLDKLDIAMLEDVGTGADQLVQLDSNAKLPAIDASNLINITAANLTGPLPASDASAFTNLTAANINGTIPDAAFPAILPARNAQALTNLNAANLTGTINSGITYAGDGGPLTNLNASNLSQGTIPTAVIPDPLPILDGSALTGVTAVLVGDGSGLTNLDGSEVATGTIDSARLDTGVTENKVIMVEKVGGVDMLPTVNGSQLTGVQASLTGDGSGLTLLDSAQLTGTSAAIDGNAITNVNAANLTGTINSGITYAGDGGPLTNLTSGNLVGALPSLDAGLLYNVPAGNLTGTIPLSNLVVKQVKTYTKANAFSTSSDTFVDVTDMEISITTSATNSRLLVFGHLALSATSNYSWGGWHVRLTRDGTVMTVGSDTTSGNDEQGVIGGLTRSDPLHATHPAPFHEVDVPTVATNTTLVYKVQVAATHLFTGSTCTVYVNRSASPGASNGSGVGVSTITVLEVAV